MRVCEGSGHVTFSELSKEAPIRQLKKLCTYDINGKEKILIKKWQQNFRFCKTVKND